MKESYFESSLLRSFINPELTIIDVGAFKGEFIDSVKEQSKHVYAFEPLPHVANYLRTKYCDDSRVTIFEIALSNEVGIGTIYTPRYLNLSKGWNRFIEGWSSIYKNFEELQYKYPNQIPEIRQIKVHLEKLDNLGFREVGFIKIDVEGAELDVILGATHLISKNRPIMLVEIEERHRYNSLTDIPQIFQKLDYIGFFVLNKKLLPISEFDKFKMQSEKVFPDEQLDIYINNFYFLPKERSELLQSLI